MKQLRIVAGAATLLALAACGNHTENVQLTKSGLNPDKFKAEFKGDSTALYTLVDRKSVV